MGIGSSDTTFDMTLHDAEQMAVLLMKHHGVLDYKFSFMERRKKFHRAGQCDWKKKLIQLQPTFVELNYPMIVKQTILHEIAHALRPRHGHNKFFQKTACALGHRITYGKSHTYYGSIVKRQ
jgi:predicted SprT family Zn-dependent metalloprotease